MSDVRTSYQATVNTSHPQGVDMKLEVAVLPVSDVDRQTTRNRRDKNLRSLVGSAPPRSSSGHDWAIDADVEPSNS